MAYENRNRVLQLLPFFFAVALPSKGEAGDDGGLTSQDGISITKSNRAENHTRGELIFFDDFNTLDLETWLHESTLGSKNWEFQAFINSRKNSFVRNGTLFIKPSLSTDLFQEHELTWAKWNVDGPFPIEMCTDDTNYGCERKGTPEIPLNPVISAKLRTVESFYFKYGRVEVRAKLPGGDWIRPAVWMLPRFNNYGAWPASGEIDIVESRGNQRFFEAESGKNIGSERITSTLHFGPAWPYDGWELAHAEKLSTSGKGFDRDFHVYGLTWTDEFLEFSLDGVVTKTIRPPRGGFWQLGEFDNSCPNPWKYATNKKMAPFDQKFYLILHVAIGGGQYFPDNTVNKKGKKPWVNDSAGSVLKFFEGRSDWFPTWEGDAGALQIDYIKVYAI